MASACREVESRSPDATACYVVTSGDRTTGERRLWRARGDVRGSYPGYRDLPPQLSDSQLELTPRYLFAWASHHAFCVPNSAIERVALLSTATQQRRHVLLVDYCDQKGILRRLWLRLSAGSVRLHWFDSRARMAARFASAGLTLTVPEEIIPGLDCIRLGHQSDRGNHWNGHILVSLATGDYRARLDVLADRVHCTVDRYTLVILLSHVVEIELRVDRLHHRASLFLSFNEQDHRIDLRLQAVEADAGWPSGCNVLERVCDAIEQQAAKKQSAHADANHREPGRKVGGDGPQSHTEAEHDTLASEASHDVQRGKFVTHHEFEWRPRAAPPQPVGSAEHGLPLAEETVEEQTLERLHLASVLHAEKFISDKELLEWRWRILTDLHHVHLLRMLTQLGRSGLLSSDELDDWRRRLTADLLR